MPAIADSQREMDSMTETTEIAKQKVKTVEAGDGGKEVQAAESQSLVEELDQKIDHPLESADVKVLLVVLRAKAKADQQVEANQVLVVNLPADQGLD